MEDELISLYNLIYLDEEKTQPESVIQFEGLEQKSDQIISYFRRFGHLYAHSNPLTETVPIPLDKSTVEQFGELIAKLKVCYAGNIGWEYLHIDNEELVGEIAKQIEENTFSLNIQQKRMILEYLNHSELFEIFLHTKFTGQKRFSLEGAETLIPMLAAVLERGDEMGLLEFVIGMAHRGRLNVLSNILKKSYREIFSEFEDSSSFEGSGDVKYHKGFSSEISGKNGRILKVALPPNPSHLEAVDPVVLGNVKAKQILHNNDIQKGAKKAIPILIHGDAAIAGQGIVYETLQFYKVEGYSTGGTLHIVVNNHIGFTARPSELMSTAYPTDIAKAFNAPVFHVNAEDPEACIQAIYLALHIRDKYAVDVFIDLQCYRKYGHNETDEPSFTQPLEYKLIRSKKSIREIYRDDLINQGVLERQMAEELEGQFRTSLQNELNNKTIVQSQAIKELSPKHWSFEKIHTGVAEKKLLELSEKICHVPAEINLHPKIKRLLEERLESVKETLDWGMGELLAYATLLDENVSIRLSGQDSGRGTFSHRHALVYDQMTGASYGILSPLIKNNRFDVYNSTLSEYGVLGFEYGYSLANPHALVIWEAQFGDFCNGGQIIIDQFITTSEQKWGQKSTLTLLLPHGYEGQGPEHSSGRMERFLTLAGDDNIQIVNPTTPAQFFHLLRRQVLQKNKKPLVVFTPKALLRHPQCRSPLIDLEKGQFEEILDDSVDAKEIRRLVFCHGKIYYDLCKERSKLQQNDVAFVRIEQLYPLHTRKLQEIIDKYSCAQTFYFAQEEPSNMGPWTFLEPVLTSLVKQKIEYVGRERSASPATGSHVKHVAEHAALMAKLFK